MATLYATTDVDTRFRSDVDDPLRGVPPNAVDAGALWSEVDVLNYMNSACAQWGEKTLPRYMTFSLKVVASKGGFVPYPTGFTLLDIRRVLLKGVPRVLSAANADDQIMTRDYGYPPPRMVPWETLQGIPQFYIRDYKENMLRLVPAAAVDDEINVTASFAPAPVNSGDIMPFTEEPDLHLVMTWMKKLAYEKHDSDTYDPDRAAKFEAEFAARAMDRRYDLERRRRAPDVVRFSW